MFQNLQSKSSSHSNQFQTSYSSNNSSTGADHAEQHLEENFTKDFNSTELQNHDFSSILLHSKSDSGPEINFNQFYSSPYQLQRTCACGGTCSDCRKDEHNDDEQHHLLQSKNIDSTVATQTQVPSIVNRVLNTPGQSLDTNTRGFMESKFNHDFSNVKVHLGTFAAESARKVNALAYTVGNHMVFGEGQFSPNSARGQRLLAHELTHTIQQQPATNNVFQPSLTIGKPGTPAEAEAESVSEQITKGLLTKHSFISSLPVLHRQPDLSTTISEEQSERDFTSKQKRGGKPRAAFIDAGKRGDDQVRIAVTRYLCDCRGRNVTEKHAKGQILPNPGFTLEFCRGGFSTKLVGNIVPNSLTTGSGTLRGDINIAPGSSGVGAHVGVEGKAVNTGSEPQVGGSVDLRIGKPGGVQVGGSGELLKGLDTGRLDTKVGAGVDINGRRIGVEVTDPEKDSRSVSFTFGSDLPGQEIEDKTCRECRCPLVYDCIEDIPPRDYEEPVSYEVEEATPLRYYFRLDSVKDTPEPSLLALSQEMLNEVSRKQKAGAKVSSIVGYASPEDNREKPAPNAELSLSRAKRLREILRAKLGESVQLPQPEAGGELLGRTGTITPGSGLSDAITMAGFKGPEEVSAFLIGTDIPNPKLAEQFLALLQNEKFKEPAARLNLFGIDETSVAAPKLLAAIDLFIANKGKGRRPWENVFSFLRFAKVTMVESVTKTYMDPKRTSGSLKRMGDSECTPYAGDAESRGLFGPFEAEPKNQSECPQGEPHNREGYDSKCKYD